MRTGNTPSENNLQQTNNRLSAMIEKQWPAFDRKDIPTDMAPHCLVVDDNPTVLMAVARMLSAVGCRVDTGVGKADVLRKISAAVYDLVVTDLEMPEINGFELARRVKEKRDGTKVIVMTGRSVQICMELMAQRLADGWLLKPFGINELQTMLAEVGCFPPDVQCAPRAGNGVL